jgi:hypothetical protein
MQIQDLQLCTPWTGLVLKYVCMYVWERFTALSDPQIHLLWPYAGWFFGKLAVQSS